MLFVLSDNGKKSPGTHYWCFTCCKRLVSRSVPMHCVLMRKIRSVSGRSCVRFYHTFIPLVIHWIYADVCIKTAYSTYILSQICWLNPNFTK